MLTTDHQLDVATWACLKAMVFEYAWPDPPVFTQADREVLMTQLRPPASVQIRLAAIESQGQPLLAFRRIYKAASGPLAICTTIVLGCVVVQVFGGPGAGEHGFRKAGGASGTFVDIFPPTFPDAAWPPAQALDDTTIEAFAHPLSPVVD